MRAAVQWPSRPLLRAVAMAAMMLLLDVRASAQESDCQHKYIEQPPPTPHCDPYAAGTLIIECKVEIPLDATDLSVGWFLDCDQLYNNSDVTITTQIYNYTMVRRLRSRLTIENFSDTYAGHYTCNLLGEEEFIPSNLFRLPTEEVFVEAHSLAGCTLVQSVMMEKCAELSENMTIPMSLTCTEPVMIATSSSDITITSTASIQMTSTPIPMATPLTLPRSSPPLLMPSSTSSKGTQSPEDTTSSPNTASVWLSVVGAVAGVFFVIIIILAIVFVCMCLRRSKSVTID